MKRTNLAAIATATVIAALITACGGPRYYGPQAVALTCPVPQALIGDVFSGRYGTDGLQRPLNPEGIPVGPDGNCLTQAPVTTVYAGYPSAPYINVLTSHYGYSFNNGGLYLGVRPVSYGLSLFSAPGVTVNRTYVAPSQRVTTVRTLQNYTPQRTTSTTTVNRGSGYGSGVNGTTSSAPLRPGNYSNNTPYRATTSRGTYDVNRPTTTYSAPQRTIQDSGFGRSTYSATNRSNYSVPSRSRSYSPSRR